MSISIYNETLSSDFKLTNTNSSDLTTILRDFKINGKYIDKIYWCDPELFPDQPDNCGLIYKRYNNIIPVLLSGHVYNILPNDNGINEPLNQATITLDRLYTRVPSSWVVSSYTNTDLLSDQDGYYEVKDIFGNSTYKVTVERKGYATYIDTGYTLKASDTTTDFYINPIDDTVGRIFLYWNAQPSDLDIYVLTPDGSVLGERNSINAFGYVNQIWNNQYGPEIISLNTYVLFDDPLKIGGSFDIYSKWISENGSSMNSTIKVFTQQFGINKIENNLLTDNINRTNSFWHAGKLNIKSGIESIDLTKKELITFEAPFNVETFENLGMTIEYFNPRYGHDYYEAENYPGVIDNTIDNNRFTLYENVIYYILKDYPFEIKLLHSKGQITNFTKTITDNYNNQSLTSENAYVANMNLSGFQISKSAVSAYLYLNESFKQKDQPFATFIKNDVTSSITINIREIFQNRSIPIIILDKNNKPLKNLEYRYLNDIDSYRRYRYVITKRLNRNEYFFIRDVLKQCKIKFTLGVEKEIQLSALVNTNDFEIPSSFNKILPFVYHNVNELNGFKTVVNDQNNKILLYGNLQHYSQRFFNRQWTANNHNYQPYYYNDNSDNDYGPEYEEYYSYYPNMLNDFYSYRAYYGGWINAYWQDRDFFAQSKRRISYIQQTDQYKIHLLNFNNLVTGYVLPQSSLNVQYLTSYIPNLKAEAGTKYIYYQDLSINDAYLLDTVSSQTQGILNTTYNWNPNGITVNFIGKIPSGQPCNLVFKRIYAAIPRQQLYGMYEPKVYLTGNSKESKTWRYGLTFNESDLIVDFYEEVSGAADGFNCEFIDFNQMYKLNTEIIDEFTASLSLNFTFNKDADIKQYIGYKILVWQQQDNNNWKIVGSNQGMTSGNINVTYPEFISGKRYKAELYAIYRRYFGNLSGIYNDDFTNYRSKYYDDAYNAYQEYKHRDFTESIMPLYSETCTLEGNGVSLSGNFSLPYGQLRGKTYTKDGVLLTNDSNGKIKLRHQELDIEYNCVWNGTDVWSIDYIYPGSYYIEITYGGIIIYSDFVMFSRENNANTTNMSFYTQLQFKTLKYNVYNEQTGGLVVSCPPDDEQVSFYDDYSVGHKVQSRTKENLTQSNIPENLTKVIYEYQTDSYSDREITKQANNTSMYALSLSATSYIPTPITKLTHGSQIINCNISGNTAYININENTLISNETIQIWTPNWYWNWFWATLDTWKTFGYSCYYKGIYGRLYDSDDNPVDINSIGYNNTWCIGLSGIDTLCRQSAWSYYQYYDEYYDGAFYIDESHYNRYVKTGKYTIKYNLQFINGNNKSVPLCQKTLNIFDNNYEYYYVPKEFPHKRIKIRPVYKKQNVLNGYYNLSASFKSSNLSSFTDITSAVLSAKFNQTNDGIISARLDNNSINIYGDLTYNSPDTFSGHIYHTLSGNTLTGTITGKYVENKIGDTIFSEISQIRGSVAGTISGTSVSYQLNIMNKAGQLVTGYKGGLQENTLLSILTYGGNSQNIDDYERTAYNGIRHQVNAAPSWMGDDSDYYYYIQCPQDCTEYMYIVDQINYWIGAFDIYSVDNASKPQNIFGLYPRTQYTTASFIQKYNKSVGSLANFGSYQGMLVEGHKFDYDTEYMLVMGETDQIAIGGYLRDINDNYWTNLSFNINVYKKGESTPVVQLSEVSNGQFDLGLLDKGTYVTQIFLNDETYGNQNIIVEEDAQQTWTVNSTRSTLFRVKLERAWVDLHARDKIRNTSVNHSQISYELEYLNSKYKNMFSRYVNNAGYYWRNDQLMTGKYNIKFRWNIGNITLQKSDLNIKGNTFSISQSKLKSYIPSSYKQPTQNLSLGTLLDKNGNIVFYKSIITDTLLSGQFTSSNGDLPDTISTCICQQQKVYENVNVNYDYDLTHTFDYGWAYSIGRQYFNDVPSNLNNRVEFTSKDGYINITSDSTELSYGDIWIKTGTVCNIKLYHDDLLLANTDITHYDAGGRSLSWSYPMASVNIAFTDKVTSGALSMHYYENWYSRERRQIYAYHKNCKQNLNMTDEQIMNNDAWYNHKNGLNTSPISADNLYVGEDYLLYYRIGNDYELSGRLSVANLSSDGYSKTVEMPYGSIRVARTFKDRNNNTDSINSDYARLILIREEGDGYDEGSVYQFAGNNKGYDSNQYGQHIKTGHYRIKLQSNIPGKMPMTIQYERLAFLKNDVHITSYVNTNTASIQCNILKSDGTPYTASDIAIKVWHNDFEYSVTKLTDIEKGIITLSLFNIPFKMAVVQGNSETIKTIKSVRIKSTKGTRYQLIENKEKIDFETTNQSEIFYITLN